MTMVITATDSINRGHDYSNFQQDLGEIRNSSKCNTEMYEHVYQINPEEEHRYTSLYKTPKQEENRSREGRKRSKKLKWVLAAIAQFSMTFVLAITTIVLIALWSTEHKERGDYGMKKSFPNNSAPEANVAFFANLPITIENNNVYENIVFNNTVTNIGNAYNSSDGVFTAPADGVYVFMVTLTRYMEISWAYVLHNGIVVAKLNFFNVEEQSSQTVILDLKTGDQVNVKYTSLKTGFGGDLDSTFAGFLLYKHSSSPAATGK